ncbi:hypothetical protein BD413DRAFT_35975 [Trametes elegans]|nr:hypothetical protein BD413DRAFT_35975 [Trametes elegans]
MARPRLASYRHSLALPSRTGLICRTDLHIAIHIREKHIRPEDMAVVIASSHCSSTMPPSDKPLRASRPAAQDAPVVSADGASATQLSPGTLLPNTPTPIKPTSVYAHSMRKAIEEADEVQQIIPDTSFLSNHLTECPQLLLDEVNASVKVKGWIDEIKEVTTEEQKLYKPVADLFTLISGTIHSSFTEAQRTAHHIPDKAMMFLDHHRCSLAHFPISNIDDKPDIVGVYPFKNGYTLHHDGSYREVPYHRVETIVEAKAIYGSDATPQVARYCYNALQARPDRPSFYGFSVKPQCFQIVFASPMGLFESEDLTWDNLSLLCAYIYSLYIPPDGHILHDTTIRFEERTDLGPPTWMISTPQGTYRRAEIVFVGHPWGRGTIVLRVVSPDGVVVMIKEYFSDSDRRYEEGELLDYIHENGFVPGTVRRRSVETVQSPNGGDLVFRSEDGMKVRRKRRLVLIDVGEDLRDAKSVNDLLMTMYDALEVHRTLAQECHVLHRDMSLYNILMYPQWGKTQNSKILKNAPPLIEDILAGEKKGDSSQARCLLIDFDNGAKLVLSKAKHAKEALRELQYRTGTPMYIARAVAIGAVFCTIGSFDFLPMPLLSGEAKSLYIKLHGSDRYNRYNDETRTFHGGVPPPGTSLSFSRKAKAMRFHHRWEYDAESVFWTMYSILLRVTPKECKTDLQTLAKDLTGDWDVLQAHTITNKSKTSSDHRHNLLCRPPEEFAEPFPAEMQGVATLLYELALQVCPCYAAMSPLPPTTITSTKLCSGSSCNTSWRTAIIQSHSSLARFARAGRRRTTPTKPCSTVGPMARRASSRGSAVGIPMNRKFSVVHYAFSRRMNQTCSAVSGCISFEKRRRGGERRSEI